MQGWALHELISLLFPQVELPFYGPPKYPTLYTKVYFILACSNSTRTFIHSLNFVTMYWGVVTVTDGPSLAMRTTADSGRVYSCTSSIFVTSQ
jgi:hypothetical protein